jgi:hypothetical protein
MVAQRWAVVRKLCGVGKAFRASGAVVAAIACNGWHATLRLEGREAIKSDVERWDTSALAGRFRLVQLVLLGEMTQARAMIPALLEQREVSAGALREWPILEGLRADGDVQQLLEQ